MGEDTDSGWSIAGMLVYAGSWGGLHVIPTERGRFGWMMRETLGTGHKTYASTEDYDDIPMAMIAIEQHAEERELAGAFGMVAVMQRMRSVNGRTWSLHMGELPDTKKAKQDWFISITFNLNFRARDTLIDSVLAQHNHEDMKFFKEWSEAMAFADAWYPPELQTLCCCIGEL